MHKRKKTIYADDNTEGVGLLLKLRLPWLLVGLVGASFASILVSRFENVLNQDVRVAFFLPAIVYMSDAVGTQTESIYVRNLGRKNVNTHIYLLKESILGLTLGLIFGLLLGVFAQIWLHDFQVALAVGLAMLINMAIAPILAILLPSLLQREHTDPALGAGPFATILQDILSLMIYFVIAGWIIF